MIRPWLILFCLSGMLVLPLAAQDKDKADEKAGSKDAAPADDAEPADEGASDPAVAEFDKVFGEWKDLLAKLQNVRTRYVTTPRKGNQRDPIKKEYAELVQEGEKLEPKLIQAAEAAFAAVGNKKPEIGKFLAEQLKYYVEHDNYEPAVPIARALIDNHYDNPRVYNYGGLAAFCTNDLDDAEKWLKEGDKHSVLEVEAKQYLDLATQRLNAR